jgi:predicted CopG family antitoxin
LRPIGGRCSGAQTTGKRNYTNWVQLSSMATGLGRATTITVTEGTRRMLEAVKGEGESFDDLLRDLLEDTWFDDEFYKEIERRWSSEKRVSGPRVMRKAGLS